MSYLQFFLILLAFDKFSININIKVLLLLYIQILIHFLKKKH